jgi:hypothetical protein
MARLAPGHTAATCPRAVNGPGPQADQPCSRRVAMMNSPDVPADYGTSTYS